MKIDNIEREGLIFSVTFVPNWLERLFNIKPVTKQYKITDSEYMFGKHNNRVYLDKKGEPLGNGNWIGEAIDNFRNKW